MDITAIRGDITKLRVEAVASPEDSQISMGGGLAGKILLSGGDEIRIEAQKHAPVRVGEAIMTKSGKLPCKNIIHTPTMEQPQKTSVENVRLAMKAALECAEKNNVSEIAVPALGTGTGKIPFSEAAKVMVDVARNFKAKNLKRIIFVAYEEEFYRELEKNLMKEK